MDVYLKEGIATMQCQSQNTPGIHFWATGIVLLSYYYQYSPSWISHHGCWEAPFWHPVSTPRGSHFWEHLDNQSDPSGPLNWWFTMPPCTIYVLNSSISDYMLSSTPWHPLRSFWSDKDPSSNPHAILLFRSWSISRTMQVVYTCSMPNLCATTYGLSSKFFNFWFLRSSSILQLHFDSSHCWSSLKDVTLHSICLFQAQCSHVTSNPSTEFVSHLFWSLNCFGHEASFHFQYHPKVMDKLTNESDFGRVPLSLLQLQQDNWSNSFH